jgi:hypothetical protein
MSIRPISALPGFLWAGRRTMEGDKAQLSAAEQTAQVGTKGGPFDLQPFPHGGRMLRTVVVFSGIDGA